MPFLRYGTCTLLAGYLRLCTRTCAYTLTHTHTHIHNFCNTFCFSTATMVMQMCLNVTLYVNSLPCRVHDMWWLTKVSFRQVPLFLLTLLAPTAPFSTETPLTALLYKVQIQLFLSTPWRHMGECGSASTYLNLSTRGRWGVSFIPKPLYPQRKGPPVPTEWKVP